MTEVEFAIFILGRFLYGGYFLLSGINHFTKTEMLTGYAVSRAVTKPSSTQARWGVYGSGLLLLTGGVGILFWIAVPQAIMAIVIFLAGVSFSMHNFWSVKDPNMKMSDMINFMKNMALAGAALMMLSIPMPWN